MASILVMDDEATIRTLFRVVLEREGHSVDEAADGTEGLEMCRDQAYDVVVVDLVMPRMAGIPALLEIRAVRPETRFVVITGHLPAALSDEKIGQRMGDVVKLAKPMRAEDIVAAIDEALGERV